MQLEGQMIKNMLAVCEKYAAIIQKTTLKAVQGILW